MSPLSSAELQELAFGSWRKRRPLELELWRELARHGLYEWAAQEQAKLFLSGPSPAVPTLEYLRDGPREQLVLTPPPEPNASTSSSVSAPISRRRLNRGKRAQDAVLARKNSEQALGYTPRHFVMFALPHKRVDATEYERRNGRYLFRLSTRNGSTVPFGQDRLFPIWLATAFQAAGMPENNRIRFRSGADILAAFQQADDGKNRAALRERIRRWYNSTLDVFDDSHSEHDAMERYALIKRVDLWYQSHSSGNQYTLWQNVIELDADFAHSLRTSAVPIDFQTVVALRDTPGALDLYVWQAHRSWELDNLRANRPVAIKLPSLLAQLGTSLTGRAARRLMRKWQATIKEVWAGCPNFFDGGQDLFFLYPGRALGARSSAKLPGVLPNPPVPLRALPGPNATQGLVLRDA